MESVSPVVQLLDLVWDNSTRATGRSNQRRRSAMHTALWLAIESGWSFAPGDFGALMGDRYTFGYYSGGPWGVNTEPYYSLACNTRNVQAARSFEVWAGRRSFVSKSIYKTGIRGCYNTGRLSVGDIFILNGSMLKVTSFAKDGSHLTAVDYRPGSAPGEDKYPRRVKVTREMLKESSAAA